VNRARSARNGICQARIERQSGAASRRRPGRFLYRFFELVAPHEFPHQRHPKRPTFSEKISGKVLDQTPYMYRRSAPERANISEINDIKIGTPRVCAVSQREGRSSPCTLARHSSCRPAGAYRAYTFAFHHHLDQRCQCRKLARLAQGFLPLLHIGAQAASAVLQCLPPLCRQVAFPVRVLLVSGRPESQNAAACDHRRRSRHKTAKEVEARRTGFVGSCE
jgi:hypothetical protein